MGNFYETIYKFADGLARTAARFNTNWDHIDTRLDNAEDHAANRSNPHVLTAAGLGASAATHTHTVAENFTGFKAGAVSAAEVGPRPKSKVAGTISSVWATLGTASDTGAMTIDIQKSGDYGVTWATIFSTKITIDQDEFDSDAAATAAVVSVTAVSANDQFKFIVDDAGANASDVTVGLRMTRTPSED